MRRLNQSFCCGKLMLVPDAALKGTVTTGDMPLAGMHTRQPARTAATAGP